MVCDTTARFHEIAEIAHYRRIGMRCFCAIVTLDYHQTTNGCRIGAAIRRRHPTNGNTRMTLPTTSAVTATSANTSANHGLIGNALQLLAAGLGPYVADRLRAAAGVGRYVPDDVDAIGDVEGDVSVMLRVIVVGWNDVFRDHLGAMERSLVSEIRETRNRWAHLEPVDDDDLDRALDSIGRLLNAVGANSEAERVDKAKHRLRRKRYSSETTAAASGGTRRDVERPAAELHDGRSGIDAGQAHTEASEEAPEVGVPDTPGVDFGGQSDMLIRRGIAYRQKGDFGRAVADFEEAIGINRESAEAWYQRALTWGYMGEFRRAINDFNRAIMLNREYGDAYNDRGYAQFCLGDYGSAVNDFESAIRLNPDDEQARINLEKARRRGKEQREAENRRR